MQPDGKFRLAVSLKSAQTTQAPDTVHTFSPLFDAAQETADHTKHEGIHLALIN